MAHDPVPAPGHDDEPSPPGDAARDGTPGGTADDFGADADPDLARLLADIASGRVPVPSEEELRARAVLSALGTDPDLDPVVLAAMEGPDGLASQAFNHDQAADTLPPGPLLAALTEHAAGNVRALSDDGVLGLISAARRLAARAEYLELTAVAEFTARRQAQLAASVAAKDPRGQRAGEFPDAELGMHLLVSGREAGNRMDQATALTTRLPATFAALGAGTLTPGNAHAIWFYTRFLSDADTAHADAVLAAAAPTVRQDTLAAKAAALEMALDPEAARARKEHARRDGRRVEARREPSGNMSYGGRELSVEEALAVSAAVEADAAALARGGLDASIRDLRVTCFLDRLLGHNPLDRLTLPASGTGTRTGTGNARGTGNAPGTGTGDPATAPSPGNPADPGSDPAPFPALITLLVPAGTALGWSTTPGELGRWGPVDPWDTRRLVQAASRHPRSRWCVTAVVILSFRVSQVYDLRRPVVDSVADGTRAA